MTRALKIGIIGDFDKSRPSQTRIGEALDHASKELSVSVDIIWLPTKSLDMQTAVTTLLDFHALWAGPGVYENPEGAIRAIKFCRERQWPFIGT